MKCQDLFSLKKNTRKRKFRVVCLVVISSLMVNSQHIESKFTLSKLFCLFYSKWKEFALTTVATTGIKLFPLYRADTFLKGLGMQEKKTRCHNKIMAENL